MPNRKLLKLFVLAQVADEMEKMEMQSKEKRKWVRDWVGRRKDQVPLYAELQSEDREKFFTDFRLYPDDFEKLLHRYLLLCASHLPVDCQTFSE